MPGSLLDTLNPTHVVSAANGSIYLRMSGTSASAAVVSGSVALLLERQPLLSPNRVNAMLTGTTQTFGAGLTHGLVDAFASVTSAPRGYANQGLIPADAFSRALYPVLHGQPLISSDTRFHGVTWAASSGAGSSGTASRGAPSSGAPHRGTPRPGIAPGWSGPAWGTLPADQGWRWPPLDFCSRLIYQ
ncbi:MAG: hypothetical protein E6I75_19250 [Chloroflexi bacterium]|nr:MAG: hypothetical protein E6I75_19250 [Chloroflexota bacterium]